jgi:hypothetical protein
MTRKYEFTSYEWPIFEDEHKLTIDNKNPKLKNPKQNLLKCCRCSQNFRKLNVIYVSCQCNCSKDHRHLLCNSCKTVAIKKK